MEKDFDGWHAVKKRTHARDASKIYFREREVWWIHLGVNIGYEQDGKGSQFLRPAVVLKKHNQFTALVVPISRTGKRSRYHTHIGVVGQSEAVALSSQIRVVDVRRLIEPITKLPKDIFRKLVHEVVAANFAEWV